MMKKGVTKTNILLGALFLALPSVWGQTVIEDHWSPYDYPKTIDEGVKYHLIVKGDTLWDIAQHYFQNPLLWPQLYQANPYIKDPDLIYPGDPVILEIGVVVSDGSVASQLGETNVEGEGGFSELTEFAEGEGQGQEGENVSDRTQTTSMMGGDSELVIIPAGDRTDLECSTYIYPMRKRGEDLPFNMHIMGGEAEHKLSFGIDDVVYIDKGERDGIKAGDVFSVRHPMDYVYSTGKKHELLGMAIDQVGRIRIIAVQERGSTGVVIDACDRVTKEDFMVPYEQEPIPLITELPPFDRWESFDTSGNGSIVYCEDNSVHVGIGSVINADLGLTQNVAPGDIFIIYRPNPHNNPKKDVILPNVYLGQAVALRTSDDTSVLKIIEGVDVMRVGDLVVPYR
ncbi:MAG: LysM peptidoglycan-binding domain-containing protein [Acidobacteria bacterium]|nr:LysM peptidoglycan-binding domain-containing protein [Acidobacteriota bacterium]MCB9397043.1 LysM peptidoglycan-binding domain-containing protein [Acidobacteriota bacterium]